LSGKVKENPFVIYRKAMGCLMEPRTNPRFKKEIEANYRTLNLTSLTSVFPEKLLQWLKWRFISNLFGTPFPPILAQLRLYCLRSCHEYSAKNVLTLNQPPEYQPKPNSHFASGPFSRCSSCGHMWTQQTNSCGHMLWTQ